MEANSITNRYLFIHGLEGTSQGVKAKLFASLFPGIRIPDFRGSLPERMEQLRKELQGRDDWIIIGSSLGGLMGAMYAFENPEKVSRLILLAPALIWPEFAQTPPSPIDIPTLIIQGRQDQLIPLDNARSLAEQIFNQLDFRVVDDDHGLHKTVHEIDWRTILPGEKDSMG